MTLNTLVPVHTINENTTLKTQRMVAAARHAKIRPVHAKHEPTELNLTYPAETAGRIMSASFITVDRDMSAGAALEMVRAYAPVTEQVYSIYVTGPDGRLDGVVSLRELLVADSDTPVAEIMSHPAVCVTTDTDQERAARVLAEHDFLALPVIDDAARIVGVVTVDDAMDILDNETTEDLYHSAGLTAVTAKEEERSDVMVNGSVFRILRSRLPFLVITLIAGMLAGGIVEHFEASLESIIAVAFFIPLIMDMGGNVGSQSSTIFARAVALGHVDVRRFWGKFAKEVGIGFIMGAIAGVAGGLVAGVWQQDLFLGLAVGFSLVATITLSALLGFLVPWALMRMGTDQAAGSAPIITSIKDITGLIIYFSFVALFMSHML